MLVCNAKKMRIRDIAGVLSDQAEAFGRKEPGTLRDVPLDNLLKSPQIVVISGIRRAGKSTLLRQFAERLEDYYYLNLDDERLVGMTLDGFADILLTWKKCRQSRNILLDEVQNVEGWERFVRRVHDEGYKVILTGSNSHLLSSELSTRLTGRYKGLELFPFSFSEYLRHAGIAYSKTPTTTEKAAILAAFDEYRIWGGFPYYCTYKDHDFLTTLYENILYKDLIFRHTIREKKAFRELAQYVLSNVTQEVNCSRLKNLLGFKSPTSVKNYLSFMEEAYLVFQLSKYDYSLKKQYTSNRKLYAIDNGIRNAVGFSFSPGTGQLLENLVFIELRRRMCSVYFHKETRECDFLIKSGTKITAALQVTDELLPVNEKREYEGLAEALERYKLSEGTILTSYQEDTVTVGKRKVRTIPIWKWLLFSA